MSEARHVTEEAAHQMLLGWGSFIETQEPYPDANQIALLAAKDVLSLLAERKELLARLQRAEEEVEAMHRDAELDYPD